MSKQKILLKDGFSLLEILIAFVVLSVAVTTLLPMFSVGMRTDSYIENMTKAVFLAQEKIEEIKSAVLYDDIDGFAVDKENLGGDFADFQREVIVSSDPKEVNVNVYWDEKDAEQSLRLVTVFADYDY